MEFILGLALLPLALCVAIFMLGIVINIVLYPLTWLDSQISNPQLEKEAKDSYNKYLIEDEKLEPITDKEEAIIALVVVGTIALIFIFNN